MTVGAVGGAAVVQQGVMQTMGAQLVAPAAQLAQSKAQKPIRATEIKAYLHAWCTKQAIRPEYTYDSDGKPPKVLYSCRMRIPGYDFEAKCEAKSKKDAQTASAWMYSDYLVKEGKINAADLPARTCPTQMETDNPGGWTVDTARQRLNRFCTHYGLPCNITNEVQGTPQARLTTAEVTFNVPPKNRCLTATANGPNKKVANAKCALAMIQQLFKLDLIETRGEPEKKPERTRQDTHLTHVHGQKLFGDESMAQHGTKRKAENQLDEYGNWNRGNCRERLDQYKNENEGNNSFVFKETVSPEGDKFKCVQQLHFGIIIVAVEGVGNTEELSQVEASLQMIVELYKGGHIEGNKRTGPNAKRYREEDGRSIYNRTTSVIILPKWGGSGRLTPWDDRHVKAKLLLLEHSSEEKNALITTAEELELMLKKVSDQYESKSPSTGPENRALVSVMRVGAFARGLLLKDELHLELVVTCREKPTIALLEQVYKQLAIFGAENAYNIELNVSDAAITATKTQDDNVTINTHISFTSTKFRPQDNQPEEADPPKMLPRQKCVDSLMKTLRTSFFQNKAPRLLNCIATCRIFKEIVRRDNDWDGLTGWPLEMLIIKSMTSARMPETVGDCMRRVLSSVSSGILLPGGCKLLDVDGQFDLFSHLTPNQRHSITQKAQQMLRFLSFRRIHELLDIDRIENPKKNRKNGEKNGEEGNGDGTKDSQMDEVKQEVKTEA